MRRILSVCVGFILASQANAQSVESSHYDQYEVFKPLLYVQTTSNTRSALGAPGKQYWQNRADYKLSIELDTVKNIISGEAIITYTNNSPDQLNYLWLQLDQNMYKSDSRGMAAHPMIRNSPFLKNCTQGYKISAVLVIREGRAERSSFWVTDTRMKLSLFKGLAGGGKKIVVKIRYSFEIPEVRYGRMGLIPSSKGSIYQIAQWYPRMAVYDDIAGWNVLPFLGTSEFYLDYGDFDYTIRLPSNMLVAGSGELTNPTSVFSPKLQLRLNSAQRSDKVTLIRDSAEVCRTPLKYKTAVLQWHFKCKNARDVSWAASKAFMWDAVNVHLPNGKKTLAQSFYPVESIRNWSKSTEYVKAALELYSKKWDVYRYPVATNIAGIEGGMEYPGIIFCGMKLAGPELWETINHEFGHNIFPMTVGSNERKFAWMDEGLNTFINGINTQSYKSGKFYRPEDTASPPGSRDWPPIMSLPDIIGPDRLGFLAYRKPALGLNILRNEVLGPERFDEAFRLYIRLWSYKHPTPSDFFHVMDNAAGEDLSWFWNEWFFKNWDLDQAIKAIDYKNNNPAEGSLITIENKGQLALPVVVKVKEQNGDSSVIRLPVEIWQQGAVYRFPYHSRSKLIYVVIDPDNHYPDVQRENNSLSGLTMPEGVSAVKIVEKYVTAVGGLANIKAVANLLIVENGHVPQFDIQVTSKFRQPDAAFQELTVMPYGLSVNRVMINGQNVVVSHKNKPLTLNETSKKQMMLKYRLFPELNYLDHKSTLLLGDKPQIVNNRPAYELAVTTPDSLHVLLFFDMVTGFKVKQILDVPGGTYTSEYGDYREIKTGVKIPFTEKINDCGQVFQLHVSKVDVNEGIDDAWFKTQN